MTLTSDERQLIELYRKAKRRRETITVITHEATVKMIRHSVEEAMSVGVTRPESYPNLRVLAKEHAT